MPVTSPQGERPPALTGTTHTVWDALDSGMIVLDTGVSKPETVQNRHSTTNRF